MYKGLYATTIMTFKIYTKTGDAGQTGLYGADRVSKSHARVEAYGTVDELNSFIGVARAALEHGSPMDLDLEHLQNALFDVGADLATRQDSPYAKNISRMDAADIEALERLIDSYSETLPELRAFIHPTGTPASAHLQVARAVCRRAEREVIRLSHEEGVNESVQIYLNRLSDLLFTLARAANLQAGGSEERWQVKGRR